MIGRDNYLFQLKLKEKDYEVKIVNKLNDIILDINELPDHRIIVITDNNIIVFNQEKDEYIIKRQYPIKDSWKIVAVSSTERFYENFHQYYSSEILPNKRLLLNSFSTELIIIMDVELILHMNFHIQKLFLLILKISKK